MDLIALQGWLDNASFAVLLVTMLLYWCGAAFPSAGVLPSLGTAGMGIANLTIATLLIARWIEAGYFPMSNLYESLFALAWGITAMHFVAERMSRSALVGVFTAPHRHGYFGLCGAVAARHHAGVRAPGARPQVKLADDACKRYAAQLCDVAGGSFDCESHS